MLWENEVFDSDSTDAAIVVSDSAIRACIQLCVMLVSTFHMKDCALHVCSNQYTCNNTTTQWSSALACCCHHRMLTADAIIRHQGPFSRTNGILLAAPVQVHVGDTQRSHLFLCMAMVVINLAANLKLGEEYLVAIHHCLHLLSEAVVCPPHTCAVPQVHET